MNVEEQLVLLSKLAQEDMRLTELGRVLQKGPKELAIHRRKCQEAEAALDETKELRKGTDAARLEAENGMATSTRRLEQAVENAKRITSLEQSEASRVEIGALENRRDEFEEEILRQMETVERLDGEIPSRENTLVAAQKVYDQVERKVPQLVNSAKKEAIKRMKTREDLVAGLDPLVRRMYQTAAGKGGNPLTTVVDKVCQSCHNTVPPQFLVETEQGRAIHVCTRCTRIVSKVVYSE